MSQTSIEYGCWRRRALRITVPSLLHWHVGIQACSRTRNCRRFCSGARQSFGLSYCYLASKVSIRSAMPGDLVVMYIYIFFCPRAKVKLSGFSFHDVAVVEPRMGWNVLHTLAVLGQGRVVQVLLDAIRESADLAVAQAGQSVLTTFPAYQAVRVCMLSFPLAFFS